MAWFGFDLVGLGRKGNENDHGGMYTIARI